MSLFAGSGPVKKIRLVMVKARVVVDFFSSF
jgi:hypothetical protein